MADLGASDELASHLLVLEEEGERDQITYRSERVSVMFAGRSERYKPELEQMLLQDWASHCASCSQRTIEHLGDKVAKVFTKVQKKQADGGAELEKRVSRSVVCCLLSFYKQSPPQRMLFVLFLIDRLLKVNAHIKAFTALMLPALPWFLSDFMLRGPEEDSENFRTLAETWRRLPGLPLSIERAIGSALNAVPKLGKDDKDVETILRWLDDWWCNLTGGARLRLPGR